MLMIHCIYAHNSWARRKPGDTGPQSGPLLAWQGLVFLCHHLLLLKWLLSRKLALGAGLECQHPMGSLNCDV